MLKRLSLGFSLVVLVGLSVSGCENAFATEPSKPLSAEAYCATFPSIGFGNFFYCGTTQGNLQLVAFPDGAQGFCQTAGANNLGLVGYVAYTYGGGIGDVETQSAASETCRLVGNECPGYIRCTRE